MFALVSSVREPRDLPLLDLIGQPLEPGSHHKQTGPNFWKPGAARQLPHFGGSAQIFLSPGLFVSHRRLTRTLPSYPDGPGGGLALMSPHKTAMPCKLFPDGGASKLTLGFRGPVSASSSVLFGEPKQLSPDARVGLGTRHVLEVRRLLPAADGSL